MSARFPDHFSGHARDYAAARPTYPDQLFEYLAALSPGTRCAWDCATGSGQAAVALAEWFDTVIATDASARQIEHATDAANVEYRIAPAESSGLDARSVNLITAAQAVHWFDFDRFYSEVNRVAVPGAIIAVWSYGLATVAPKIDSIIQQFYNGAIGPYWPPERSHVETEYREIPFPYELCSPPRFRMQVEWTADAMLDYVRTWSSVRRHQISTGADPVAEIERSLSETWGANCRDVSWPLILKVGRVAPA